jgi:hypothetical protein
MLPQAAHGIRLAYKRSGSGLGLWRQHIINRIMLDISVALAMREEWPDALVHAAPAPTLCIGAQPAF